MLLLSLGMRLGESLGTELVLSTLPTVRSSSGPKDPSVSTSALLLLGLELLGLDLLGLGIGAGVGNGVGFGVGGGLNGMSVGNFDTDGAGEGRWEGAVEIVGR